MVSRLILLVAVATSGFALAAERPNIVWIVSEDSSKHYFKLFDEAGAETPNIAALAEEGVIYPRAFSNSPVCSVARTTLATSCYAPRIGTQFHRRSKVAQMPEMLRMFPWYLKDAGYYTTNNSKKDYNATEASGTWDESSKSASWRNRPEPDQPFFHLQSHTESHESSLHFSEKSYQEDPTDHDPSSVILPPYFPDTPLFRYTYARYLDNIQKIDRIVGETVTKLEEDGLLEDTFIFFFSDHGGVLPRGKGYAYESGLHIPLVIRIPKNFRDLVDESPGSTQRGFVSFVDFGPTALNLAGVEAPAGIDGVAFLGEGISSVEVSKRNTTYGYADRFDEKYELIRTLRIGDCKYMRSFQPYYPDGLQNNYRYQMLAYREWRDFYNRGDLNEVQAQFFEPKSAEMLFDLSTDPHETRNLADDPDHQARLVAMREQVARWMKNMPDLSLFPESKLYTHAMDDPVQFGQDRKHQIERLLETADLMLQSPSEASDRLSEALQSKDPFQRYWAATVCASFGDQASELVGTVRPLLEDQNLLIRVRAAEFLGMIGKTDPRSALIEVVESTAHPVEQLIALNSAAFFHGHPRLAFPFDATSFPTVDPTSDGQRRVLYVSDDWIGKRPNKKKSTKKN
ncbi:MAG: sulfatase-like hydrolase/transferase [Verrucomicrobiota bacterium]